MGESLLELDDVETYYGGIQALFGMRLDCVAGKVSTLLGRNGMGKTTTVSSILGIQPPARGEVRFDGRRIDGRPAHEIARLGIGLVPEGRQIFPNLSVRENLVATAGNGSRWTLGAIYELFPDQHFQFFARAGIFPLDKK